MKLSVVLFVAFVLSIQAMALSLQARVPAHNEVGSQANKECDECDHKPKCADPALAVPFLRGFLPGVTDHLYATSDTEMSNAVTNLGYKFEGNAGAIFTSPQDGTVPFFRVDYTRKADHTYMESAIERDDFVVNRAYVDEGIAGWVYPNQTCGGTPLYRLYHPTLINHFYTQNATERDNAARNLGYKYEGIACYVLTAV